MNRQKVALIVIALASLLLVIVIFYPEQQTSPTTHTVAAQSPVGQTDNPPPLSDLFLNRTEGPHQSFRDEESCLKCHQTGIEIPGMGNAKAMPHEFRNDCVSCHILPDNG